METATHNWINVPPADNTGKLEAWVNNLPADQYKLLELLSDKIREQAFNEVMDLMENSQLAQLLKPQPRKSFKLLRVKNFRLV